MCLAFCEMWAAFYTPRETQFLGGAALQSDATAPLSHRSGLRPRKVLASSFSAKCLQLSPESSQPSTKSLTRAVCCRRLGSQSRRCHCCGGGRFRWPCRYVSPPVLAPARLVRFIAHRIQLSPSCSVEDLTLRNSQFEQGIPWRKRPFIRQEDVVHNAAALVRVTLNRE